MLGAHPQRALFCGGERIDAVIVKAGRIFALRAEHEIEERGRDLVVLRIGFAPC